MSKVLETDTVMHCTGELVNVIKPCLREEEIGLAREEFAAIVRRHLQKFAERLRREDQRLGRPAAGWGESK
jgi:hypothetical protein